MGCADDTREAYVDDGQEGDIAGCDGVFLVPGVVGTIVASCGRAAGNDGSQPDGVGCTADDLCAAGWHVCAGAAEVASHAASGACPLTVGSEPEFWLTGQAQTQTAACADGGVNNLVGCGRNVGEPPAPEAGCAPLDVELNQGACDSLPSWDCGTDATAEAQQITKTDMGSGGVLCCRSD
jgi:hypothetical protein